MIKEKKTENKGMNEQAEIIRKKYIYRKYILTGKLNTSLSVARKMIGPDCAYHLYKKKCPYEQI